MRKKYVRAAALAAALALMLSACGAAEAEKQSSENVTQAASSGAASASEEGSANTVRDDVNGSILGVANRQELAEKLGTTLEELDNFLLCCKNLNMVLPDGAETETEYERGVTEEGLPWVTRSEIKTMMTAYVITTENWSEWIVPYLHEQTISVWDSEGNETGTEHETVPVISVKEGYDYDWTSFSLKFTDNVTGESFEFNDSWSQEVSEENGVFYVTTYDENWNGTTREFSASDYTCTKADGIVFSYDIPEELLCVSDDEGNYYRLSEYEGEYEESDLFVVIVDDTENWEYTQCYAWLGSAGAYVFER